MKKTLIIIALLFFMKDSFSQLYFKNSTNMTIHIAVGWYNVDSEVHKTKGWYNVVPGQTIKGGLVFTSNPDYFYYYAFTSDGSYEWTGDAGLLLDINDKFSIYNATDVELKHLNKNYSWKNFIYKKVSFGMFEKKEYTVDLNLYDRKTLGYKKFVGSFTFKNSSTEATAIIYQKGSTEKYHIRYELATYAGCMNLYEGYGYKKGNKFYFSHWEYPDCKIIFNIIDNNRIKLFSADAEKCLDILGVGGCSFAIGTYTRD